MGQLETDLTPPALAVQNFWAQLSADERQRFSDEFPQFMCYTDHASGLPPVFAQDASQTAGINTTSAMHGAPQVSAKGQNLLVHGLASTVTAKELAGIFGQYGRLLGITVMKRPGVTDPAAPNLAQVNFAQAVDAERAARATDGAALAGGSIRVELVVAGEQPQAAAPPLNALGDWQALRS